MTRPGEFKQAIVEYTSDSGIVFGIRQKRSNALALGNKVLPLAQAQGYPQRWRLRTITIQTLANGELWTREEVIGHPANPLFRGDQQTVVIDGVVWRVVARRGEYRRGPFAS